MTVHRVRKGDTMWSIARQYGVSVTSLRKLNPSVGSIIRPGQPILVGGKTGTGQPFTHRVAHGETLWEIASQYGITVTQIRTWNGMTTRESLIRPGDDLTLYR